ncbi:MAG: AraC family transcriptional regulator [Polyangiales bacterium]
MTARILMQTARGVSPLQLGAGPPLLNSRDTPWTGIPLELHQMASADDIGSSGPLDGESGLLVFLDGSIEFTRRTRQRDLSERASHGSVAYLSGNERPDLVRMRGQAQVLALELSTPWFQRVLLDRAPTNFARAQARDDTLHALASAMHWEVTRGAPSGRLYAESLSLALLSYALEQVPALHTHERGELSSAQQRQLRSYVLANLDEDLSISHLASLVERSERHFGTLFKRAFGTTPHRYVLGARLAEGARLLGMAGADIAEVALRVGFSSQSHFTHAFRRAYGITPARHAAGRRKTSPPRL